MAASQPSDQVRLYHARYFLGDFAICNISEPFCGSFASDGEKFVVTSHELGDASVVSKTTIFYRSDIIKIENSIGLTKIAFNKKIPGLTPSPMIALTTLSFALILFGVGLLFNSLIGGLILFGFGLLFYLYCMRDLSMVRIAGPKSHTAGSVEHTKQLSAVMDRIAVTIEWNACYSCEKRWRKLCWLARCDRGGGPAPF